MEGYMEKYMMAHKKHGPPCSACRRSLSGVRLRCCELQVSGLHWRNRRYFHKLSFACFACGYLWYHVLQYVRPVTTENQQSLQIWPIIKNICSVFPGWILKADFYQTLFLQLIFTKFLQVDGDGSLGNNPSASITPGNYLQVKSLSQAHSLSSIANTNHLQNIKMPY